MARHWIGALTLLTVLLCINWSDGLRCGKCDRSKCRTSFPDCKYGVGKYGCRCCDTCLQGPGEICGGYWNNRGLCGHGLLCVTEDFKGQGKCVRKITNEDCFVRVRCNRKRCPKTGCSKYNSGKNKCACCPKCLRRSGQTCGNRHPRYTPCRKGLKCIGEKRVYNRYEPGRCNGKRRVCECNRICTLALCPLPQGCRYHWAKPKCVCCAICKKGAGEACGDQDGVCRDGYECKLNKSWFLDGRRKCYRKRGTCTKRYDYRGASHEHGGYSSYESGDYSSESGDYSTESKDYSSGSKDYSYDDENYSSLEGGGSSYVDHKKTYKKIGTIHEHSKYLSEEKKGYSAKEKKSEVKHGDGTYSAHEQSSSSSYNKKSELYKTKSITYDYETQPYYPPKAGKGW